MLVYGGRGRKTWLAGSVDDPVYSDLWALEVGVHRSYVRWTRLHAGDGVAPGPRDRMACAVLGGEFFAKIF